MKASIITVGYPEGIFTPVVRIDETFIRAYVEEQGKNIQGKRSFKKSDNTTLRS
jgi:hypothetical protein